MRIVGGIRCCIDVKRLYLKDLLIFDICPHCEEEANFNGNFDYLSYPTVGVKGTEIAFFCRACSHFWKRRVRLDIVVSEIEEKSLHEDGG